jgi:uncharacterized protein (UPF0147 family)
MKKMLIAIVTVLLMNTTALLGKGQGTYEFLQELRAQPGISEPGQEMLRTLSGVSQKYSLTDINNILEFTRDQHLKTLFYVFMSTFPHANESLRSCCKTALEGRDQESKDKAVQIYFSIATDSQKPINTRVDALNVLEKFGPLYQAQRVEASVELIMDPEISPQTKLQVLEILIKSDLHYQSEKTKAYLHLAQNCQIPPDERIKLAERLVFSDYEKDAVDILLSIAQNNNIDAPIRMEAAQSIGRCYSTYQREKIQAFVSIMDDNKTPEDQRISAGKIVAEAPDWSGVVKDAI